MKISIENFKSIKKLHNFEVKPLTILSGVNSSGKSSFIQLLLLLKQTVELNSANQPFYLDGDLYPVREFKDIVFNHDLKNDLKISFQFSKKEIQKISSPEMKIFNIHDDYDVGILLQIGFLNESVLIKRFKVNINLPEGSNDQIIDFKFKEKRKYGIETNTAFFGKGLWNEELEVNVDFLSFFPLYFEKKSDGIGEKVFLKVDWVKELVNSFFENLSYLEPNREPPKYEYPATRNLKNINPKGDNVAQILEKKAREPILFNQITNKDNKLNYQLVNTTLAKAVKYWMCDIFNVAEDLQANKIGENYQIMLVNKSRLLTNIKHVGFGISQLLPIVVEGLLMPINGTLIIEQPEIHLHPKLQSKLYDFLYGLTLQGKKIIVETHSSHFITRMRRRIAEDESDKMDDRINLTFIEDDIFRSIELNDYGTMNYYPKDFIEPSSSEQKAIVKAQMTKRTRNK